MKTILLYILLLFMAPALPALEKGAMPLTHSPNPEASGSPAPKLAGLA